MPFSLARQRRTLVLAASAAVTAAAAGQRPSDGPEATEYEILRAQLGQDLAKLREIQSIEAKIALKRELVPNYLDWIEGVLSADAPPVQDDVVVQVMIWSIDIGDFAGGLALAEYVLRGGLALPSRFDRTAGCFVAEAIAEAALQDDDSARPSLVQLQVAFALTEKEDMPDQVRAKLHKAIGQAFARIADGIEEGGDGPAGARRAAIEHSLEQLRRALKLNEKAGVKKEIERLDRELKKLTPSAVNLIHRVADRLGFGHEA